MINGENTDLEHSFRQLLKLQLISALLILLLIAGVSLLMQTFSEPRFSLDSRLWGNKIAACLYGSVLAIAGTILSARSIRRATKAVSSPDDSTAHLAMTPIFSGLLNKLLIVGGGIGFGLIYLKLVPIEMLISYIVVQFASLWTMVKPRSSEQKDRES